MHLLIDGQALQTGSSRQRGIGRYSSNLLRAIAAVRSNWRIEVVQNSSLPPIAASDLNGLPVLSFQPPLGSIVEHRELHERYYADWLTARGPDGVLILSHCEGWEAVVPAFRGARPRVFGIAYDLIPLRYPEQYLTEYGAAAWYSHRFCHLLRSDALLAISEATAGDVRALGGDEAPWTVNIGGAVDPRFTPLSPEELTNRANPIRNRFRLQREFVLYVGAPDYRKNLHGALRAFGLLPADCRANLDLAIVCRTKPAEQAALEEMAKMVGVASSLRLIGSASDEDLRALYQMSRLFFFPSLYEGLGLPVLEALHCGAPVVTSNCSALPEYAGSVSWLGDPSSPEAMARVLRMALAEPRDARRAERQSFAQTFRWEHTAERACRVLEQSMTRRLGPVSRRRRLAWVSPLTTNVHGQIDYVRELLPHLDEHYEIELIAVQEKMDVPADLEHRYLILTAHEMSARHAVVPYDMFLYQLSPAPPEDLRRLLLQFPGLALLNDFSAADLTQLGESKLPPEVEFLVHNAGTWQQARRRLNSAVLYFPRYLDPRRLASAYAGWIDRAIRRYETSDGYWRSFAVQGLAKCGPKANTLIDTWAVLRARGQQRFSRNTECRMRNVA
jgi:glycosyltransferase involved in cell wall biosynthesis